MSQAVQASTGWKPIPLALKALAVLMVLWSLGSAMNLPNLLENGLPLLGHFVFGLAAFLIVLMLDFIGPAVFLLALWHRKSWGPWWASIYIGLFLINGVFAFLMVRDELGVAQIIVPNLAYAAFLAVIWWNRTYFNRSL